MMGAITFNHVRDAIVSTLVANCTTSKIYDEEIEQGIDESSFFVKLLNGGQARELNRRYKRVHDFDIHYFGSSNEEMNTMAEKMYDILERVSVDVAGNTIAGKSMSHEVVDRVLHFFVSYEFHVLRERAVEPIMQVMEQEGNLK
jgi:hypothetical protein